MKIARFALALLAFGLFVEPAVVHHGDVAFAAAKKKTGRDRFTKAQRAKHHELARQICRKRFHTTTQVEVRYKQNGQISVLCWGN
jgi:ADP-ribosylglycohydrolase